MTQPIEIEKPQDGQKCIVLDSRQKERIAVWKSSLSNGEGAFVTCTGRLSLRPWRSTGK